MRAHHTRLLPVRASGKRNRAEPNLIFNQDSKNQVSAESLDPIQEANQEIKRGTMRHASGGRAEFGPSRFGKRSAVFDKCPVLEIKDSALFLAFAFQDIKDIKRRRTLPVQPAGGYDHDSCTDGAGRSSGAINLRPRDAKAPGMKSNGFDYFQTDSRQSAGFLIFNQSFYSSCFAPTRFAGWAGRSCAKQGSKFAERTEGRTICSLRQHLAFRYPSSHFLHRTRPFWSPVGAAP